MKRIYLIVVLIVAVSALAGCGDQTTNESEGANGHEVAELDDLIVPNGLKVMSPEANRMNQELDRSLNRLLDEYDGGNNLSEDEQQAYEEEIEAHVKRVEELEENRLYLITGDEAESPAVIKMEIDYEWIESMLS